MRRFPWLRCPSAQTVHSTHKACGPRLGGALRSTLCGFRFLRDARWRTRSRCDGAAKSGVGRCRCAMPAAAAALATPPPTCACACAWSWSFACALAWQGVACARARGMCVCAGYARNMHVACGCHAHARARYVHGMPPLSRAASVGSSPQARRTSTTSFAHELTHRTDTACTPHKVCRSPAAPSSARA